MPSREAADAVLLVRCSGYTASALFSTEVSGVPPRVVSFDDAIGEALDFCGVVMNDPSAPTQADFDNLALSKWFMFLAVAEFRVLSSCAAAIAALATQRQVTDVTLIRDASELTKVLKDRAALLKSMYGYGASKLKTGAIRLGFRKSGPEF